MNDFGGPDDELGKEKSSQKHEQADDKRNYDVEQQIVALGLYFSRLGPLSDPPVVADSGQLAKQHEQKQTHRSEKLGFSEKPEVIVPRNRPFDSFLHLD